VNDFAKINKQRERERERKNVFLKQNSHLFATKIVDVAKKRFVKKKLRKAKDITKQCCAKFNSFSALQRVSLQVAVLMNICAAQRVGHHEVS